MFGTLFSCGTLLAILLASHGVGRQILRRLDLSDIPALALVAWSTVLGLIAHAALFSLAAFTGILSVGFVGGVTVVTCFWGLGELACAYLSFRIPHQAKVAELADLITAAPIVAMPRRLQTFVAVAGTIVCGAALVAALAPPISSCVLAGSLNLSKQLIKTGPHEVPEVWDELSSPQFAGMLYAWAYAMDGPVSAALVNWSCGILLLTATALLAKPLVGAHYAWLAGLLPLAAPGLRYQMTIPLSDLPLAMFCAFGIAAWWRGTVEQTSRRWLIVAGLCWGAALATNALAAAALVAVVLVWCHEVSRSAEQRLHDLAWKIATALGLALMMAAPWWTFTLSNGGKLAPITAQPSDWLQLGPLLIVLLPGLLLTRRLRGMHTIGELAICTVAVSWLMVPQSHVFLLVLPLLALLGTWVLMELVRYPRVPRWAAATLLLVIAVAPTTDFARDHLNKLPVAIGWQSREDYLRQHVPNYAAAQVANRVTRPDAVLASNDPNLLYFDCRTRLLHDGDSTHSLAQLQSEGVTHVLWRQPASNPSSKLANSNAASLPLTCYNAGSDADKAPYRYELRLLLR